MTILLIQAPNRAERTYPIQLAYVASALTAAGYKVEGRDLSRGSQADLQALRNRVPGAQALVLCTSRVGPPAFDRDWPAIVALVGKLRTWSKAPLIVCGTLTSLFPAACAASTGIDYAICGDAEPVLPPLFRAITGPAGDLPPGVHFRDARGRIRDSGPAIPDDDLDGFAPPDYSIVDLKAYRRPLLVKGGLSAPVLTSRGCTQACAACPVPTLCEGRIRRHSVQRAVDDLERLGRDFGVSDAVVEDDDFAGDRTWVEAFCQEVIGRGLGMSWQCLNGLRVSSLDADLIGAMAQAGCNHLALGIETFRTERAREIGRPYDPAGLGRILAACAGHGVRVSAYFLVDYPRLDWSEALATAIQARRHPELLLAHFSRFCHPRRGLKGRSPTGWPGIQARLAQVATHGLFYLEPGRLHRLVQAGAIRPGTIPKILSKLGRL